MPGIDVALFACVCDSGSVGPTTGDAEASGRFSTTSSLLDDSIIQVDSAGSDECECEQRRHRVLRTCKKLKAFRAKAALCSLCVPCTRKGGDEDDEEEDAPEGEDPIGVVRTASTRSLNRKVSFKQQLTTYLD